MVFKSECGAKGLVKRLRETFVTFGIPEELTSDGGLQFTAGVTQAFLRCLDRLIIIGVTFKSTDHNWCNV